MVVEEHAGPRARPDPTSHAWRIERSDGLTETVVAHHSRVVDGGSLIFLNHQLEDGAVPLLVRAFAPHQWNNVAMVEVLRALNGRP